MDREIYIWIGIVGLMIMTIIARCALILWPKPIEIGPRLARALRFAPMAAIAAIIVPGVLYAPGGSLVGVLDPKVFAVAGSLATWFFTRQMASCILGGLAVYVIAKLAA
jgi:branched-subunit amino acid transport protein